MTVAKESRSLKKGSTQDPVVDREACRLEYVTSSMTLEAVAKKMGVKGFALRRWAREDNWDAARKEYRESFREETTKAKIDNAAAKLSQWNEETLLHAGLLREAARRQFQYQVNPDRPEWRFKNDVSAKDISAAASAHVAADKLARLALGAATDNINQTNKSLPATVDDFF